MKKIRNWFIGDYLAKTDNVFERAKIELTYSFCAFFFIMGVLYYGNLIANNLWYHFYVVTFAVISLGVVPFILKYKQNVLWAAGWYVGQQFVVGFCENMIEEGKLSAMGALFSINTIMFCFFVFGTRKGFLAALPFMIFFTYAVINQSAGGRLVFFHTPPEEKVQDQPIVTLVPFFLSLYVIWKFITTRSAAEKQIEMQRMLLETKNKETTDSIKYAKRLQEAILPPLSFIKQYLPEHFVLYKPKDIVAGDFYWFYVTPKEDTIYIAAADCTGHGVPGAMVSVVCSNALNRTVKEFGISEPGKILDKVRELVIETFEKSESEVKDGMDIALLQIKKCEQSTIEVQYSGANNPLWYIEKNELKEVKADKQPIGTYAEQKPFTTHKLSLHKGASLYVFTDGFADQFGGPKGKKYKYKQLEEKLLANTDKGLDEQKHSLEKNFNEWKGNLEQIDDVLVIGIKV